MAPLRETRGPTHQYSRFAQIVSNCRDGKRKSSEIYSGGQSGWAAADDEVGVHPVPISARGTDPAQPDMPSRSSPALSNGWLRARFHEQCGGSTVAGDVCDNLDNIVPILI